jgi:hypothetical protein
VHAGGVARKVAPLQYQIWLIPKIGEEICCTLRIEEELRISVIRVKRINSAPALSRQVLQIIRRKEEGTEAISPKSRRVDPVNPNMVVTEISRPDFVIVI